MTLITIAILVLSAARAEAQAMPYPSGGKSCPSGYYSSGGFCTPLNRDSRPAVARPPGATCPSGWYASGSGCVKLNR